MVFLKHKTNLPAAELGERGFIELERVLAEEPDAAGRGRLTRTTGGGVGGCPSSAAVRIPVVSVGFLSMGLRSVSITSPSLPASATAATCR